MLGFCMAQAGTGFVCPVTNTVSPYMQLPCGVQVDCTLVISHSSALAFFQSLFCHDSLVFGGRVVICTSCLGMGNMQLLILYTLCGSFCVNHHLLQIEASLIRVYICINKGLQR